LLRTLIRLVLLGGIGVSLLVAMAAMAYFAHGSLELSPTEEQEEKVRLVAGMIFAGAALAIFVQWGLLRWMKKP
jgi:NADH:ubiquinone oxidoreductase subunit 2 (subunit N)